MYIYSVPDCRRHTYVGLVLSHNGLANGSDLLADNLILCIPRYMAIRDIAFLWELSIRSFEAYSKFLSIYTLTVTMLKHQMYVTYKTKFVLRKRYNISS